MSIQNNFPAIKPTLLLDFANSEVLDSRITFTRASTAAYYDGKTVAKAEENLLVYSQEFDNAAWVKTNVTVTANATVAPDGTTTADVLLETATNAAHYISQQAVAGNATTYTYSVYIKPNGRDYCVVSMSDQTSGDAAVGVNLTNGTTYSLAPVYGVGSWTGVSAVVTSTTNGFYRIVVTGTKNSGTNIQPSVRTMLDNSTFVYTGDITKGLYIWGAQLEQRSSATAYTPTTTAPVTKYAPVLLTALSGVARFQHNPTTGESLGLLIEEQRTNLLTYSEDLSQSVWDKANGILSLNTVIAPDGTLTGDKFISTTNGNHYLRRTFTATATAYTYSVYIKEGGNFLIGLYYYNVGTTNSTSKVFNLQTGVISTQIEPDSGLTSTASITSVGNNWYRCSIVFTAQSGNSLVDVRFYNNSGQLSYIGDGFSGVYPWGAQLENASFNTSYIPTVASQVTRAADSAIMTGTNFSSWFNLSEGSFYAEVLYTNSNPIQGVVTGIGTLEDEYYFTPIGNEVAGPARGFVNRIRGGEIFFKPASVIGNTKQVGSYQASNTSINLSVNGNTVVTSTSATLTNLRPSGINFGGTGNDNYKSINSTIKKIAYYPLRLTNAQPQGLTS